MLKDKRLCNDLVSPDLTKADIFPIKGNTKYKKLIKNKLSIIDFAHIHCLFLVGKDKKITKVKETHYKKLKNLGLASPVRSHNSDKRIINHSSN